MTAVDAVIGGQLVRSSGIVLDGGRGLVLTSTHSLWGARSIRLTTGVGIVYGRIVARAPCDDLALIETQPRIPGLVSLRPTSAPSAIGGALLRAVGRRSAPPGEGSLGVISIPLSRAGGDARGGGRAVSFPRPADAVPLDTPVAPAVSGGPVFDSGSRVVGMAIAGGAGPAYVVPWRYIAQRLAVLRPGPQQVYVGWRSQYRCLRGQNRYARAVHPGFRPGAARLNAPVPATRLPGTAKEIPGG